MAMAGAADRIYVGGLAARTAEQDLEGVFSKYGHIEDIDIKAGFAFIQFRNLSDAEDAVRGENNKELLGRSMVVQQSRPKRDRGEGGDGCFVCGSLDHWARECPESRSSVDMSSNCCLKCGEPGHYARTCTNERPRARERSPPRRPRDAYPRDAYPRDAYPRDAYPRGPPPPRRDEYARRDPYAYPPPPRRDEFAARGPPPPRRDDYYRDDYYRGPPPRREMYPPRGPPPRREEYVRGPPPPPLSRREDERRRPEERPRERGRDYDAGSGRGRREW